MSEDAAVNFVICVASDSLTDPGTQGKIGIQRKLELSTSTQNTT